MKITKETLKILKNFSNIENSIYVDEKKILKIINSSGTVIGIANIVDELGEFGIYDLSQFIQALSLFDEPDVEFKPFESSDKAGSNKFLNDSKNIIISQGKRHIAIRSTPKDLIPFKAKNSSVYIKHGKKCNASFNLTEEQINNILKAGRISGCDIMKITFDDGHGIINLFDSKNSSSNTYTEGIEGTGSGSISIVMNNIEFIPGDYEVSIMDNTFIKFQNKDIDVFYIIVAYTG